MARPKATPRVLQFTALPWECWNLRLQGWVHIFTSLGHLHCMIVILQCLNKPSFFVCGWAHPLPLLLCVILVFQLLLPPKTYGVDHAPLWNWPFDLLKSKSRRHFSTSLHCCPLCHPVLSSSIQLLKGYIRFWKVSRCLAGCWRQEGTQSLWRAPAASGNKGKPARVRLSFGRDDQSRSSARNQHSLCKWKVRNAESSLPF